MTHPTSAPAGSALLRRRSLLQLAGAGGLAALAGGGLWPTTAAAEGEAAGPLRFAVVTDTHADVDVPTNLANLRRVFTAVEADAPAFVLNCGDITEYGAVDEYAAYRATVPDSLWPLLKHVPGNHESRWDPTAGQAYRAVFGDPTFSFDAAGLHVVGLDATQVLQEPGLFGPELLEWLVDDLRTAGRTPSVLFLHYPLGGRNAYVNDTEALWSAIEPFDVRGVFAGHIHREEVSRINGLTQVTGLPTKGNPFYYRVERVAGERGSVLEVTHVTVPADPAAPVQTRPFTTIPLAAPPAGLGPLQPRVRSTGERFSLTVPALRGVAEVSAKVYPQGVFGGTDSTVPTPLTRRGRGMFTGELDAAALPAGTHRVQVRATAADGRGWEAVVPVEHGRPGGALPVRWTHRVGGRVQGALAEHEGLVVVASTSGTVQALRPDGRRPGRVWERRLGPVHRGPAFSADAASVLVPAADSALHALDAATGESRWRADLGVPVLSAPLVTAVDGEETVLVTAGDTLWALDAGGRTRWRAEVPVMSAGRVACDGERVVLGAGDGRAYGLDARTGERLWGFSTNTRTTAYSRLIYGPWDATVALLPGGAALVATVSNAHALDPATGAQRWSRAGSYVYTPALTVAGERVLLVDERGVAALVDPADGGTLWTVPTAPRSLNAGPVLSDDAATAWLVGTAGLLVEIDLAAGVVRRRRQLFTANTFSTPVRVGELLLVGDQAGDLHAVDLS
ncbi:PQQ-binding-like beta-propeller repeat protein [Auraticoccus sp. F435]|uniref:PQQ-binding-like beta-propeller repeat protein n=1 Tax=Auraticoccus cholistanensis TaxID=2656650 RepID=A0A6A9URQ8_9ACTN|nr:PQQ-binding-like beta-propeller repeat protein [Auraticoccus cholistanensis]MVA75258.1 PQQ-binding-like beta-propeller repeat protein [Auraticoccus cholistanensis]